MPEGYGGAYRERHDTVIDHTVRDVVLSPDWVDVSAFVLGRSPGVSAYIGVDDSGDRYIVGVLSTHVGWTITGVGHRTGHVIAVTTAQDAVRCALGAIGSERDRQERSRNTAAGTPAAAWQGQTPSCTEMELER